MGWVDWFRKNKPVPVTVTRKEVKAIVEAAGYKIEWKELADKGWVCPTDKQVLKIAKKSGVEDREYISEVYDCDNFCHSFLEEFNGLGYIIGSCVGRRRGRDSFHAWVFYINDKKQLKFLEPQNYSRNLKIASIRSWKTF